MRKKAAAGIQKKSERKRTDEAVWESEARLLRAQHVARMGFLTWDLVTNDIYWSDEVFRLYGVDQRKVRPTLDLTIGLVHPDDLIFVQKNLDMAVEGISEYDIDHRILRPDGQVLWVHAQAELARSEDGVPVSLLGTVVDITERKRAEEEAERNAALNQIFLDNLPPVAMILRPHTREIVACNKAGEEAGAAPGKICYETWGQSDSPCPWCLAPRLWETGEAQHLQPEGIGRVWDCHWVPISDDLYLHYAYDITERKRAEEALRESEELHRITLSNISDAVFMTGHDGDFTYVCPNVGVIFGYSETEVHEFGNISSLLGNGLFDHDRLETLSEITNIEREIEDKAGRKHGLLVNVKRVSIKGGTVLYTCRDVTELNRASDALRESEERLKEAQRVGRVGGWQFDVETQAINWSDEVYRLFERDPSQGPPTFEENMAYYCPEDSERLGEQVRRATDVGEEFDSDYHLRLPSGRSVSHRGIIKVGRDDDGKVTKLYGTVQDITERKLAEEELRRHRDNLEELVGQRTRELQDAQEQLIIKEKLATLGQLAGGVAHELRNPLGAIKNTTYLLKMLLEQPDEETKEALEILNREVATSERIIAGLFDFGGQKVPIRGNVDLNEVLRTAMARVTVPDSVRVVSQSDESLPPILADPDQLSQALGNVIRNAVQAMPAGGQLTIKTGVPCPGRVTASVTDTGAGIPPDTLDRLFEPLFTTKAKGIGLGLPLAKSLVEVHGGTIQVESAVGRGTTFTVNLPTGEEEHSQGTVPGPCQG